MLMTAAVTPSNPMHDWGMLYGSPNTLFPSRIGSMELDNPQSTTACIG